MSTAGVAAVAAQRDYAAATSTRHAAVEAKRSTVLHPPRSADEVASTRTTADGVYRPNRWAEMGGMRRRLRCCRRTCHTTGGDDAAGFRKRVDYLEGNVFAESLIGSAVDGPLILDDYLRDESSGLDRALVLGRISRSRVGSRWSLSGWSGT